MQRGAGRVGQRHDARVQRVGLTVDPNSAGSGSGRMNERAVTAGRGEAAARVGMRADGESRRQQRFSVTVGRCRFPCLYSSTCSRTACKHNKNYDGGNLRGLVVVEPVRKSAQQKV